MASFTTFSIDEMVARQSKLLEEDKKRREKCLEYIKKNQGKKEKITAPESNDEETYAVVANCPKCGNNDPRPGLTGSLVMIDPYMSSGGLICCIACEKYNYFKFTKTINAKKVTKSWFDKAKSSTN